MGIPAEVLFLNFESSYSASRGALLEAWKLFNYWRRWRADNFCQPIYFEWLCEAVCLFIDGVDRFDTGTAELTGGDWELNHRQRIKEEMIRREAGFTSTPADDIKEDEDSSVEGNS